MVNESMSINGKVLTAWDCAKINFILDSLPDYTIDRIAKETDWSSPSYPGCGMSDRVLNGLLLDAVILNPLDPRVEHRVGKTETYDVVCSLCVNSKPRKTHDVYRELANHLEGLGLYPDEYFGVTYGAPEEFPSYHWVAAYAVPGGSEGWYIHVDAITGDNRVMLFCGKTLREGREATHYMYQIAEAIAAYFA